MSVSWFLDKQTLGDKAKAAFSSLDAVWTLEGKLITSSSLCEVIYVELDGCGYYLKRYSRAGKGVAEFLGKSKARAEWENLRLFQQWGLPVASVVACGEEGVFAIPRRGVVITAELKNTKDLRALADEDSPLLKNRFWLDALLPQVAEAARVMHRYQFAHNDLKWRNLLVTVAGEAPGLFLIDCPSGRFWMQPFFEYRRIKDLACLDKVASKVLSRTQRLKFYLLYTEQPRLLEKDKRDIKKITAFFKGRE